ncbi:hypothetical protein AC1031_021242 [Aphanomyces cochlioides]|nr:hypothetical protein AC1031_021242 [Aphanomyces cochlioides]
MSFALSRVVDNFGLRDDFQRSGRIFLLLYAIYFPMIVLFTDSMAKYRLNVIVDAALGHIFIGIHILLPLRNIDCLKRHAADQGRARRSVVGDSKVALFHMYLATPAGFRDFSWFAQSEFIYESVIAWKHIMDYRQDVEGHLSVFEIYQKHIAPSAPLSLDNVVPSALHPRFAVMIAANHKYNAQPGSDGELNRKYFDPILKILRDLIIAKALPRYQQHPLGMGWRNFLTQHVVKNTLETTLQPDMPVPKAVAAPQVVKKTSLPSIKCNGRLHPIISEEESVDGSDQHFYSPDMSSAQKQHKQPHKQQSMIDCK